MDQHWHSVFDNSIRQPWLYFCYEIQVSVVNSFTLSIPYVSSHLVFIDNLKVYNNNVFAEDLWINTDIAFFYNSIRQPWLYFCYGIHVSVVNSFMLSIPYVSNHLVFIDDLKVYSNSVFAEDLWINTDIAFLTIPFVSHDSIFAIEFMRQSWIHLHCRFHTSAIT